MTRLSPLEAYQDSSFVFEGTVTGVRDNLPTLSLDDGPDATDCFVSFKVDKMLKGETKQSFEVTFPNINKKCVYGIEFVKGDQYLVYAMPRSCVPRNRCTDRLSPDGEYTKRLVNARADLDAIATGKWDACIHGPSLVIDGKRMGLKRDRQGLVYQPCDEPLETRRDLCESVSNGPANFTPCKE